MIGIDLSGRTALVTGGGRGLGRAVSILLAQAGANVAVNYLRHKDPAIETASDVCALGPRAVAVQADVSHPDDVGRLFDTIEDQLGPIHILINNAALTVFRDLPDFTKRQVDRIFEINAWPLLGLASRLFPMFEAERFGRIIAISASSTRRVAPGYAGLAMAKSANETLTLYLADYVGRHFDNVTANVIAPSGFHDNDPDHTPFAPLARKMKDEDVQTPGGRFPTTREVAAAVLFLASDLGAAVNGQCLTVDRGRMAS